MNQENEIIAQIRTKEKMTTRILHIFAPSLASRFGGQSIWWKTIFEHWDNPDVVHYVLDCEKDQLVTSRGAFRFEYTDTQKGTSQWGRATWIIDLFKNLVRHKEKYDILHVHVLWWGGLLIGLWGKWNGIPTLYESVLLDSDTPGGIINEKFGRAKVRCLKFYKAILAISEYMADDYLKFGFSKKQVFTLMNCVDIDLFSPAKSADEKLFLRQKLSIPLDAKVMVFVGSVIKRKGVDVLIQAFLESSSKDPNLYLLIVGPKNSTENPSLDEGFVNDLRTLINQNNLSGRVLFIGLMRDRQKLADFYRAADIFVFPSNKEGLGNVVLEAMASELPVLVSHLPVLEKIIQHGENGFFVPIGDTVALTNSILMLSENLSLSRKIGCNARYYVEKNHAFMAWQAKLLEIYSGLLS